MRTRDATLCASLVASTLVIAAAPAYAAPGGAAAHEAPKVVASLRPASGSLGSWAPTRRHRGATVRLGRLGKAKVLRLGDRRGRAGYVGVSRRFAPRQTAAVRAVLRLQSMRIRTGHARALMSLFDARGGGYQAGVMRTRSGLRWALWSVRPNGRRGATVVTKVPLRPRAWRTATLQKRGAGAQLVVQGRRIARSHALNEAGATTTRAVLGFGRAQRPASTGVLLVRAASLSVGVPVGGGGAPAPDPAPAPAPQPGQPAPAPAPGGGGGAPATPPADVPGVVERRGDFESGDLSQWNGVERVAADRIQVVRAPVREGGFAARFEVRPGDRPVDSNERAEVRMSTGETEGMERWYRWSTMIDPSVPYTDPNGSDFQVVAQWHATRDGQPPVALFVMGNDLVLVAHRRDANGRLIKLERIWSTPVRRGQWHDLLFHIKWSASDDVGFIELTHNGVAQRFDTGGTRRHTRTLVPGDRGNYFKFGYYRRAGIPGTGVVYHDGFAMSTVR